MANCHSLFTDFNSIIRLNNSKRKSLKNSRTSLRTKIRNYFKEKKTAEIQPKFSSQGSFVTDTIIEPIPREVKEGKETRTLYYYDIDDGVYFIGDKKNRKSVQTYHNWIRDAVDGHTETPAKDKNTCVKTLFKDGHNIDHPIYFKDGTVPELAHLSKNFIESDPKAFKEWFDKMVKNKPQLRRIVRFIKAWCDYRKFKCQDKKMPSGFIMTILACENYSPHDRDDIALKETMVLIKAKLDSSFTCYRPTTDSTEELLIKFAAHKDYILQQFSSFITNAKNGLSERNHKKACENWQKNFGDRFPCQNAKDEVESNNDSAALLTTASSSRMWAN